MPRLWRGSGGRWLVWVLRVVLWAVLLLIGYRGVAAIVTGATEPGRAATRAAVAARPGAQFPAALARAYALEFGRVYLNFSPATAVQRADGLASFLPPGADPEFGWNGAGTQTLQSEQVAGVRVLDPHRAVVMLLVLVNGKLGEIGVPIYAAGGGMVVSGYPARFPPPARVALPRPASAASDPAARRSLAALLPGFFRAYASGDARQLGRLVAGGGGFSGLRGAVTFGGISELSVPASGGRIRQIAVTVVWRNPSRPPAGGQIQPAGIQMSYAMTVVRRGGTWLVRSISSAATQPWPSP